MQWGLIKLEQWAKENSLQFNASKTKAMMFTRKHRYDPVPLYLNGEMIEFVESFKYLGVIFDRKLKWKIHIKAQIKKAKNSLMIGKRMIGKTWGLGPKQAYWLYTAIVRPMLMYGSIVWIGGIKGAVIKKELVKVQRLACLMITRAMRSTPTAGIEAMLGLEPLEITVMENAIAASIRIKNNGGWKRQEEDRLKHFSHAKIIDDIIEENTELMQPQDRLKNSVRESSKFTVKIGEREELNKTSIRPMPIHSEKINCFTDGSKTELGTGNAYKIYSHGFCKGESNYLGQNTTVFQAEVTAITSAGIELIKQETRNKEINFYVDSQSALKATNSYVIRNKSVKECKQILNKISEHNSVILNWMPGHENHKGNIIADKMAKAGVNMYTEGQEPRIAISKCVIKQKLKGWKKEQHNRLWQERTDCRQTKLILPLVRHKWRGKILNHSKEEIRILTQIITGHANLKRHRYLMDMEDNPLCDKCGMEETAIHLITECPGYVGLRIATLGRPIVEEKSIREFPIYKILSFAEGTERWKTRELD